MEITPKKRIHAAKDLACEVCATIVKAVPFYRQVTFKTCSRRCTAILSARQQDREKRCEMCGASFMVSSARADTAKFCSNACKGKAYAGRGRTEFECQHCHKLFNAPKSTKRKFCSRDCIGKASKLIWRPTFTAARNNIIRSGGLERCNRCGYSEHPEILGVHHKDRDHTNNTPDNLEVLCPICHSLEHKRHIAHGGKRFRD